MDRDSAMFLREGEMKTLGVMHYRAGHSRTEFSHAVRRLTPRKNLQGTPWIASLLACSPASRPRAHSQNYGKVVKSTGEHDAHLRLWPS